MQERIQKILSRCGVSARRKAEDLIHAGRVLVNGKVAVIGQKADVDTDRIEVDGKPLETHVPKMYYLMNKPRGVETTKIVGHCHPAVRGPEEPSPRARASEPRAGPEREVRSRSVPRESHEGRHDAMVRGSVLSLAPHHDNLQSTKGDKTVYDLLPKNLRKKVFPVGRLDKESEGLLLFTNDGELKYRLEHPKFSHEKEYEVETAEEIHDGALRKLEKGVVIDGTKTKPARIARCGRKKFRIALTEGRNRQIRRMCQKVGSEVTNLRRVRIMNIQDDRLQQGKGRILTERELADLLQETA